MFNIIFIILQMMIVICSKLYINLFFTYFSLINILIFCIYNYITNTDKIILFLENILIVLLNIFGVFVIETKKIYLYETMKYSFFKNSLPELVLIQLVFLYVILKKDEKIKRIKKLKIKKNNKRIIDKIVVLIIGGYDIYYFILAISKPYFKYKVDRFLYLQTKLSSLERSIYQYNLVIFYLTVMLIIVFKKNNKVKFFLKTMLIVQIITEVLLGNKYGIFIGYLTSGILYFFKTSQYNNRMLKKVFNKVIFLLVLVFCILFIHKKLLYEDILKENYTIKHFFNYFYQRTAQQGQLWWGTYDQKQIGNFEEIKNELLESENKYKDEINFKNENGIWKIMRLNAPREVVKMKAESFAAYTMTSNASINYYFGLFGNLIFVLLAGTFLKKIYMFFLETIDDNSFKIIIIYLFVRANIRITQIAYMSNFGLIFKINSLIMVILLALFYYQNKYFKTILKWR